MDGHVLRVARRRADGRSTVPLLIFNGIGANLELLEPFVEALQGIEVIAFDAPGAGTSPSTILPYRYRHLARLADQLMRELGYHGEIDVLGVSWGGGLAQQYAYQYPGRCRRLILAATSAGVLMVPGQFSVLRRLANPRRYYDRDYLKRIAPELYGGSLRRAAPFSGPSREQDQVTGQSRISLPVVGDLGLDQPAMAASTAASLP